MTPSSTAASFEIQLWVALQIIVHPHSRFVHCDSGQTHACSAYTGEWHTQSKFSTDINTPLTACSTQPPAESHCVSFFSLPSLRNLSSFTTAYCAFKLFSHRGGTSTTCTGGCQLRSAVVRCCSRKVELMDWIIQGTTVKLKEEKSCRHPRATCE